MTCNWIGMWMWYIGSEDITLHWSILHILWSKLKCLSQRLLKMISWKNIDVCCWWFYKTSSTFLLQIVLRCWEEILNKQTWLTILWELLYMKVLLVCWEVTHSILIPIERPQILLWWIISSLRYVSGCPLMVAGRHCWWGLITVTYLIDNIVYFDAFNVLRS